LNGISAYEITMDNMSNADAIGKEVNDYTGNKIVPKMKKLNQ
jgi:hypothetical protein